jgi:hypothetical protein
MLAQVVGKLEEPALTTYNFALAALFSEPDGLNRAVEELKALVVPETKGSFVAMVIPRWRDGDLRFEEWRCQVNEDSPPLQWFVDIALAELRKAVAAGGAPRVVSARRTASRIGETPYGAHG